MAKEYSIKDVKPGMKYRGMDRDLWHVVGTLPDGEGTLVVSKSWAKYKNRWCYNVMHIENLFWTLNHKKELEKTKKKK